MPQVSARNLAARDPALAALLGGISAADFGYAPPANDAVAFGDDFGFGDDYEESFGFGDDPNDYFAAGFGAPTAPKAAVRRPVARAPHPAHPQAQAHAAALWNQKMALAAKASTAARTLLLDPNRDSKVKVERYSFSFSPPNNLVLGTAAPIPTFTQNPSTSIKGQRLIVNAPAAGFVYLSSLQIANVNVFVGGTEDAFSYSAQAQNSMLDLPRLDPQNRATATGFYTGMLPPGYTNGMSYPLVITLQGPATLAGGYGQ